MLATAASGGSLPAETSAGGLGDLLGGLLGGGPAPGASSAIASGAPGLGSLLDLNGDGSPLDDILRTAGKAIR